MRANARGVLENVRVCAACGEQAAVGVELEVADGTDLYQPLHRIVDGRAGRRVEETLQQALRGCHNEPEQQHNNRLAPIVLANEQVSSDAFAMSEYKVSTVGSSQRA